jgi:probable non-F420 flavinoid oxidoreductase
MVDIGYHASHEQFPPEQLVSLAKNAEESGFDLIMSSDHFHPWSPAQGQSGFTWSWLGAAMGATALPFGSLATPVGWRYHPAIIAQAAATLARMFPDRLLWLAMGSGEALNECMTGEPWPEKQERNARLKEAVEIVRALFDGETVTSDGLIPTRDAKLYTRAENPPKLICAALTPETARWAGSWADGLVTVNQPWDKLKAMIEGFREGGGEGRSLHLQVHVGWAESDERATQLACEQWTTNSVPYEKTQKLRTPAQFVEAAADISPADVTDKVHISADLAQHTDWIGRYAEMGFDQIVIHNTGVNQREFIDAFGASVLPHFAGKPPAAARAV